jgi:alkaline phosphatase
MRHIGIFTLALIIFACNPENTDQPQKMQSQSDDLLVRNTYTNEQFYEVPKRNIPTDLPAKPKNIILMIGDGMGIAQTYAGYTANKNNLHLFQFPYSGFIRTESIDKYITDSAAGATAFSTGKKSYNGAIGVTPDSVAQETILETAEKNDLATGLVATCRITHATPAAFVAHQSSRNMYQAIAKDFLNTDVDVFIGGGYNDFAKRDDGTNLIDQLEQNGYLVLDAPDAIESANGDKIAGLLYPEHPPKMAEGRGEMLRKASAKALEVLSKNENGFFLMIEGSQIDWGGHDNSTEYITREMLDFDQTVGDILDFALQEGETLVIVTADHETGGFTLTGGDPEKGYVEGSFTTGYHTAVAVPVYAFGPGAENFKGFYDNTGIYHKMMEAFGF